MSKRFIRNSKLRPTSLINISSIEINDNDSFDQIIITASRFEESLKKTGAIPNEDYNIVDLFNLALEGSKVDNMDEVKNAIGEAIIENRKGYRIGYRRVDQREKQVTRGYFKNNYM